jgi:hypothetical protein
MWVLRHDIAHFLAASGRALVHFFEGGFHPGFVGDAVAAVNLFDQVLLERPNEVLSRQIIVRGLR